MNSLFYTERDSSWKNHKSEDKIAFKYFRFEGGEVFKEKNTKYNHLLFIKIGKVMVDCNEFLNKTINEAECILLPKASKLVCETLQPTELLIMTFDSFRKEYDKQMLKSFQAIKEKITYTFTPLPIRSLLKAFVDLSVEYQEKGLCNERLYRIKEKELFIILSGYYSREEIVGLFYPLIGISDFKDFVLKNYLEVDNVAELVDLSGMGRTAFDSKFREEFGISARQWMLKQIANRIRLKAMESDVTIKELMREFKFNSPTHFNWFCHHQYGCTPGELLKKSTDELYKMKI